MARVIDRDKGWRRFKKDLAKMADSMVVAVGILGDDAAKDRGEGLSQAALGSIHEFGTSDGRVPQRSFLRATVDGNRAKYIGMIDNLAGQIVDGKMTLDRALGLLGERVKADCQNRIKAGIAPELKQATIDRKGSSKPLIDTGQLVNSLSYKVRKAGKRAG